VQAQEPIIQSQPGFASAAVQTTSSTPPASSQMTLELLVDYHGKEYAVSVAIASLLDLERELRAELNISTGTGLTIEYYNKRFSKFVTLRKISELATTEQIRVQDVQESVTSLTASELFCIC
jgi:hypothetical protein